MLSLVLSIFTFGAAVIVAAAVKWGWRGAAGAYATGLLICASLWPILMIYSAVRYGVSSEAFTVAQNEGDRAALSVGGSWAVLALPAVVASWLLALVLRRRGAR